MGGRRIRRRPITAAAAAALFAAILTSCAGLHAPLVQHGSRASRAVDFPAYIPPPKTLEDLSWKPLAEGLSYIRIPAAEYSPRMHCLRLDLRTSAAGVQALPPFEKGITPRELAFSSGADILVTSTPFRYELSFRGLLRIPVGAYIVNGKSYSPPHKDWGVLWKREDGALQITSGLPEDADPEWAVGGYKLLLMDGNNIGIDGERHARTAAGTNQSGTLLYLLIVEGEGGEYPGLTSRETAAVLKKLGAHRGLNFDGGDSTLLWMDGLVFSGRRSERACYLAINFDVAVDFE